MFRERMLKPAAARSKDRWMASRGDNPSASAGPLWHLPRDSRKTMARDNQPKQTHWLSQHHLRPKHSTEEMFQRGTRKGGRTAPQR